MQIKTLAEKTRLSDSAIRYYESIGLLPPPERRDNGYRDYDEDDVARLRFVAGARALNFSLDDIAEVLALRDRREAPCRVVLNLLQEKEQEIMRRIAELQRLKVELRELYTLGQTFPTDDVDGKACVCHLVQEVEIREPAARLEND